MLAVQFHSLVLKASEAGIPLVFPVFPRIATDWDYLHKCLRPILPADITEEAARAAYAKAADAAKVRVTSEIVREAPGNAICRAELNAGPRYPSPTEIDNIALRREIGRLRRELRQLSPAQAVSGPKADPANVQISKLPAEKGESDREVPLPPPARPEF